MKEELGILSVKDDEIKQLKSRYRKIKVIIENVVARKVLLDPVIPI